MANRAEAEAGPQGHRARIKMFLSGSTGGVHEFRNGEIRHESEECGLCDLGALEWVGQKQKGALSIEGDRQCRWQRTFEW